MNEPRLLKYLILISYMFFVQSFGFLLYATEYVAKDNADGHILFILEVLNY